jgi:hypothetical protein
MTRDLLGRVARALAASQNCDNVEVSVFYAAHARVLLGQAKAELKQLAMMLTEREQELFKRASPKTQLSIGEVKS